MATLWVLALLVAFSCCLLLAEAQQQVSSFELSCKKMGQGHLK